MTWIPADQNFLSTAVVNEQSTKIDDEVAPGVIFERRSVLQVSALTAAALLFGSTADGQGVALGKVAPRDNIEPQGDGVSWDQFLALCVPLAKPLYEKKSPAGQDAYLFTMAAQAVLLNEVPVESKMDSFRKFDPKYEFELAHRGFPFIVIHWRMEPHAVLPAHCHPGTSVCTVGIEGEALVRHFEPADNAPHYNAADQKSFLIQETNRQVISPRRVSTLSETRDNIHYFVAGSDGARGIDITTHYNSDGSFSFLKFDADKPVKPATREYEAIWVGSDLQNNF